MKHRYHKVKGNCIRTGSLSWDWDDFIRMVDMERLCELAGNTAKIQDLFLLCKYLLRETYPWLMAEFCYDIGVC